MGSGAASIPSNDLTCVVDAFGISVIGPREIYRGVVAIDIFEPVATNAVRVLANDPRPRLHFITAPAYPNYAQAEQTGT